MKTLRLFWVLLPLAVGGLLAQRWWGGERNLREDAPVRTAREVPSHSTGTPNWTNEAGFEKDTFTFARLRYSRTPYGPRSSGNCFTDFPDSDLNLSFRIQQVTSIKVDPDGRVVSLTDPELLDYPWIYAVEPGRLRFLDSEVPILRKYLLNGGFFMADDFWGPVQWDNFENEMKRVFPERDFVELPMDHPVFHCVFDLKGPKNKLQSPNVGQGVRSQRDGVTWEIHDGFECVDMHVRALFDEKGRMMVIATHNCDNGDGWEREGENDFYFHEFSEKRAFPLGINILFYAMTH
jgi:hypothetical protein